MHKSLVGMGSWKQRVSASGSGGKTATASHSRDPRVLSKRGKKRQSEWAELGCFKCAYIIIGYGDEEQYYHSHHHLQVKVLLYGKEQTQIRTQVNRILVIHRKRLQMHISVSK